MRRTSWVRALVMALPITVSLTVALVLLLIALAVRADVDAPGPFALSGAVEWLSDTGWGLLAFLVVVTLLVGLRLDSSRLTGRRGAWDEVVPLPSSEVDRLASQVLLGMGWRVERAEPDFTVFVRPGGDRPAVATLTVDPGLAGARLHLTMSRQAGDGARLMRLVRARAADGRSSLAAGERPQPGRAVTGVRTGTARQPGHAPCAGCSRAWASRMGVAIRTFRRGDVDDRDHAPGGV